MSARPYQKRHVASALKLARAGANTKAVVKRWLARPYADPSTVLDRAGQDVLERIAELDAAITRLCALEDERTVGQ